MASFNSTPNLPNNLYTNGAVQFDTRQLAQMMYQENKQRRAQQAARDAELNDAVNKEMAGVFSADRPTAAANFDKWKSARLLLSNPKIQKDRNAFLEAQKAEREAYSNFFSHAGASKERKEYVKQIQGLKPEDRADEYGDYASTYMTTPLEKLKEAEVKGKKVDLSNPDSYRNMGNFDWSKTVKENLGSLTTTEREKGKADIKGLETIVDVVEHYSGTPEKVKDGIITTAGTNPVAKRTLEKFASELTPQQVKQVSDQFAAIPESVFEQIGRKKPNLKIDDPNNPYDVAATYMAQKSFLDNMPRVKETKRVENKSAIMAEQQKNRMAVAAYNKNAAENLAKLKKSWKDKDVKDQKTSMTQFVDGMIDNARKSGKVINFIDPSGMPIKLSPIQSTPSLKKAYETTDKYGKKIQPDMFGVDANDNVYPMFLEKGVATNKKTGEKSFTGDFARGKGGRIKVNPLLAKPFSKEVIVAELSKEMLSPSKVELTVDDDDDESVGVAPSAPAQPSAPAEDFRKKYNY